ncbi:MAG TPA: hypothetical protein VFB41_06545 [Solirubrobacteraceae bacterium]|nr:hypothetical protein [Solirubrobacteraceae bacterium]
MTLSGETSNEPLGFATYGAFVKDEVDVQERLKASLEQRALAVITSSGTLVTLLFALAALSTKAAATFELPQGAQYPLVGALVLFAAAAVISLCVNLPAKYRTVTPDSVRGRLKVSPPRTADGAARDIALTRIKTLESAYADVGRKAMLLKFAIGFEAAGVGCVAVAVAIVLI